MTQADPTQILDRLSHSEQLSQKDLQLLADSQQESQQREREMAITLARLEEREQALRLLLAQWQVSPHQSGWMWRSPQGRLYEAGSADGMPLPPDAQLLESA